MKIAVIGGGGREHALLWKLQQSPLRPALFCLPGNAGTAEIATNAPLTDNDAIVEFATAEKIDLVVVGPEAPLAEGLADKLTTAGIATFGVSAAAAQLESSKAFAKEFCFANNIPCANSRHFTDGDSAKDYINTCGAPANKPIVVKADGLAAGKGVVVAHSIDEAHAAVDMIAESGIGGGMAGGLLIEDFLQGEELSFFVISDGTTALPLIGVRDHKAAYDGNKGPNTGGMGTYAPAGEDAALVEKIMQRIATPTLQAMQANGMPYKGIMFIGLMIDDGEPSLIEYNVRFGDPECQVLMMLLQSDLLPILQAVAAGELDKVGDLSWRSGSVVNVVLAAENYPTAPTVGDPISLPSPLPDDVQIFHAGTKLIDDGTLVSSGGRVLSVAAYGDTMQIARTLAYDTIKRINLRGSFYRSDIGSQK